MKRVAAKVAIAAAILIFLIGFYGFVMPSLMGFLITLLLAIAINDFLHRRYRQASRTFNSAAQAVAHHEGAIAKVAQAFASRGPLSGSCYEYTRRLIRGEDPIAAASVSHVPLNLTTAVAMTLGRGGKGKKGRSFSQTDEARQRLLLQPDDSVLMAAYAQILYLIAVAVVTCTVLGFMTVWIMPTIEKMMIEFGLQLPYAWLLAGGMPTQVLMTLTVLVLVALTPILTTGSFFGIPVPRWMPVSPQAVEDKADMLHGLADAIDAGMTVDQSLHLASQVSTRTSQRRGLIMANNMIRQGVSPAESLRRSGWLSLRESEWLRGSTAARGAELLRWIADQRVRDARANLRWVMGVIFPALVVLLGVAVLAYTVGFFSTLVSLISALS